MSEEYFIRKPGDEEARGPYDIGKLQSLAEADKLDRETLYFNEQRDKWEPLSENEGLCAEVFPKPKTLTLKKKSKIELLNKEEEDEASGATKHEKVSVEDMLAAAEGYTDDTRHLKERERSAERAASISPPALGAVMIASAIALIAPNIDIVSRALDTENYMLLAQRPLFLVGVFDALMAVMCFLGVTDVFPMLRARAMVGLGYFAYVFWAISNPAMALVTGGASIGIFVCTLTTRFAVMIAFAAAAIAGMVAFAVFSFLS